MEDSGLIQQLENIKNARRVYRDCAAGFVLDNPEVMPELIQCVAHQDVGVLFSDCQLRRAADARVGEGWEGAVDM